MLSDASLIDLISSIASQGYFPGEPLLVCPCPELDSVVEPPPVETESEYTAVEGNRRLAALRLLIDPSLATSHRRGIERLAEDASPSADLPVIIFPTRRSILDYLGYRHITGIKEWDPLAKARYLQQLRDRWRAEDRDASLPALARAIGSTSPYVGRLLASAAAFDLMEERHFFRDNEIDVRKVPFSLLSTALNYENIPPYLGIDPDDADLGGLNYERLTDLAGWIFAKRQGCRSTQLDESRNMRYLNLALTSDRAVAALKEGRPVREASVLALEPPKIFSGAVSEARRQVGLAERQLDVVSNPTDDDRAGVLEIKERSTAMLQTLANREGDAAHDGGAG
jgi:hypothetical protein